MKIFLNTEHHYVHRVGWLRAAVMGANDGIVSIASLIIGVAAAQTPLSAVIFTGVAGMVAGAMSMAAGEYVSVSSQADVEKADLAREAHELEHNREVETRELAHLYTKRGLDVQLANQVALQLMAHDALAAHAREELGLHEFTNARPLQAAVASALSFAVGASLPLLLMLICPFSQTVIFIALGSLLSLALLGGLAAHSGGAPIGAAVLRVSFWGALAMLLTALVGGLFGVLI